MIALVIIMVAGAIVIILLNLRRIIAKAIERRLVARVGRARAASLIEFEQSKTPGISRAHAARRALERWEYDQSR